MPIIYSKPPDYSLLKSCAPQVLQKLKVIVLWHSVVLCGFSRFQGSSFSFVIIESSSRSLIRYFLGLFLRALFRKPNTFVIFFIAYFWYLQKTVNFLTLKIQFFWREAGLQNLVYFTSCCPLEDSHTAQGRRNQEG